MFCTRLPQAPCSHCLKKTVINALMLYSHTKILNYLKKYISNKVFVQSSLPCFIKILTLFICFRSIRVFGVLLLCLMLVRFCVFYTISVNEGFPVDLQYSLFRQIVSATLKKIVTMTFLQQLFIFTTVKATTKQRRTLTNDTKGSPFKDDKKVRFPDFG